MKDEGSVSKESNRGRPLEVGRALCGQALTVMEAQGEGIQHHCKQYDTENIIAGGRMAYRHATGHQRWEEHHDCPCIMVTKGFYFE